MRERERQRACERERGERALEEDLAERERDSVLRFTRLLARDSVHPAERVREIRFTRLLLRERERERLERETEGVTRERGERDRGRSEEDLAEREIRFRERFGERVQEIRFTRLLLRNRD